jgi:hypothetical protein
MAILEQVVTFRGGHRRLISRSRFCCGGPPQHSIGKVKFRVSGRNDLLQLVDIVQSSAKFKCSTSKKSSSHG